MIAGRHSQYQLRLWHKPLHSISSRGQLGQAAVKVPVPAPSEVLLFETVGFQRCSRRHPWVVTSAPPSPVAFPPDVGVVWVIADTPDVETQAEQGPSCRK